MFDKKIANQYFNFIKQAGYKYSKDDLGYYFNNGEKQFSIMLVGPIFQCYYNVKVNGNWVLKDKLNGVFDFNICLNWILKLIQQNK